MYLKSLVIVNESFYKKNLLQNNKKKRVDQIYIMFFSKITKKLTNFLVLIDNFLNFAVQKNYTEDIQFNYINK